MAFSTGMACPVCGAGLDSDSVFCTECGASVSSVGSSAVGGGASRACANCNAPLDDDAVFCTECGTPVTVPVATSPTEPIMPGGLVCPACRAPLDDDAVFCTTCGAKVDAGGFAPTPEPTRPPEVLPIAGTPTEPPRIFDGNDDDPEADLEMKKHFHSPGSVG